jgi:hypothetical protein
MQCKTFDNNGEKPNNPPPPPKKLFLFVSSIFSLIQTVKQVAETLADMVLYYKTLYGIS